MLDLVRNPEDMLSHDATVNSIWNIYSRSWKNIHCIYFFTFHSFHLDTCSKYNVLALDAYMHCQELF